jgi:hypothetical protein
MKRPGQPEPVSQADDAERRRLGERYAMRANMWA